MRGACAAAHTSISHIQGRRLRRLRERGWNKQKEEGEENKAISWYPRKPQRKYHPCSSKCLRRRRRGAPEEEGNLEMYTAAPIKEEK